MYLMIHDTEKKNYLRYDLHFDNYKLNHLSVTNGRNKNQQSFLFCIFFLFLFFLCFLFYIINSQERRDLNLDTSVKNIKKKCQLSYEILNKNQQSYEHNFFHNLLSCVLKHYYLQMNSFSTQFPIYTTSDNISHQ